MHTYTQIDDRQPARQRGQLFLKISNLYPDVGCKFTCQPPTHLDLKPEALAETNVEFPLKMQKSFSVQRCELFKAGFRNNSK